MRNKFLLLFLLLVLLPLCVCAGLHAQTSSLVTGREPVALNGPWKFHVGDNMAWAQPSFDGSGWQDYILDPKHGSLTAIQAIQSPELPGWQQHGHPGYTGYAWYLIRVQIPPDSKSLALLMPQYVDDAYEVYLNGEKVGGIGKLDGFRIVYYPQPKLFSIPAAALDSGRPLTIAIRFWAMRYDAVPSGNNLEGGLRGAPLLGPSALLNVFRQSTQAQNWKALWPGWLLVALWGAVGIISLFLFFLSRSHPEYLWAGISLTGIAALVAFESIAPATNMSVQLSVIGLATTDCIGYFALPLAAMYLLGVPRPLWHRANYASGVALLLHNLLRLGLELGLLPPTAALRGADHVLFLASIFAEALLLLAIAVDGLRTIGRKAWLPLTPGLLCACGLITLIVEPQTDVVEIYYYFFLCVPFAVLVIFLLRFTEQQRENAVMAGELEAARSMQSMLIPATPPITPGFAVESVYIPASEVGGDFFQVQPGDDGSLLIVVGDVSGKGLKAAMTVSTIVGALRGCTVRKPSDVLAYLNRVLHGQIGGFVTCCATLIAADGAMTLANAGHLAPYRNGEELAVDPGLPLGILADGVYEETHYQLAPNDRLTFVSDGVVEATNEKRELFGFERTQAISNQPAAAIADAAKNFGQEDDISVLSVTRIATLKAALA